MKFWTVQHQSVLETIENDGIYLPDMKKSNFVLERPELAGLYSLIVNSFNEVNNMDCSGVIFTFMNMRNNDVYEFPTYDDFMIGIKNNREKIAALWKNFNYDDYFVLEIDINPNFNPIIIEINNFQYLMPPIMEFLPPYMPGDAETIINWIRSGRFGQGYFPNSLAQAHLPYIKEEDIADTYDFRTLEEIIGLYM